jgi:cytidyltransferase-like protein
MYHPYGLASRGTGGMGDEIPHTYSSFRDFFSILNYYNMEKIVCVSGYFHPIHIGHVEYFKKSKEIGTKLMVIVNNDHQATLKKGRPFMPCKERMELIKELRCVDIVVESIDSDRTVCKTLSTVEPKPDFFCNGGDQNNNTIPEGPVCQSRDIELRDGFGEKIQSSSWLISGSQQ